MLARLRELLEINRRNTASACFLLSEFYFFLISSTGCYFERKKSLLSLNKCRQNSMCEELGCGGPGSHPLCAVLALPGPTPGHFLRTWV